jgi:hypothetical protein
MQMVVEPATNRTISETRGCVRNSSTDVTDVRGIVSGDAPDNDNESSDIVSRPEDILVSGSTWLPRW